RQQQGAVQSAAQALALADNQYREGTVSYLNVVAAQAASLNADRSSLDIAGRRLLASVALLKALGGGWRQDAAK
ncbi:MAG: RND transporter, partial [Sulfuricellaceae bacterium]|nr:RND transporter [Sulfuricellaceae bacterium]